MRRILAELQITLRRVIRLGTFRHTAQGAAGVRPVTLLVLIALWLALVAIVNILCAGMALAFNEWGIIAALAGWAVFAAAIMLFGGGAARVPLARAMADSAGIGIAYSLLLISIGVSSFALSYWRGAGHFLLQNTWPPILFLAFLWLLLAFLRAGRRLWKEPLRLPGLRFLVAALLPVFLIPNQPIFFGSDTDWTQHDVWYLARSALVPAVDETTAEDTANREPDIDFEATFYHQPTLVNKALSGLLPSPQDRPQMYFVGLAPSSAQDVSGKRSWGLRLSLTNASARAGGQSF